MEGVLWDTNSHGHFRRWSLWREKSLSNHLRSVCFARKCVIKVADGLSISCVKHLLPIRSVRHRDNSAGTIPTEIQWRAPTFWRAGVKRKKKKKRACTACSHNRREHFSTCFGSQEGSLSCFNQPRLLGAPWVQTTAEISWKMSEGLPLSPSPPPARDWAPWLSSKTYNTSPYTLAASCSRKTPFWSNNFRL